MKDMKETEKEVLFGIPLGTIWYLQCNYTRPFQNIDTCKETPSSCGKAFTLRERKAGWNKYSQKSMTRSESTRRLHGMQCIVLQTSETSMTAKLTSQPSPKSCFEST
ncbi:hypothetical protein AVEN_103793-1 [Araneus ventricosus]|uniref:Uncharacterized protein n=1 Tax=Araneus ventricosus TaxID=182803 RepID=A0A4Y2VWZ6_ARAVE|nr:hypothetical protein AVEN_103793-1 [Araneus ventricosus]